MFVLNLPPLCEGNNNNYPVMLLDAVLYPRYSNIYSRRIQQAFWDGKNERGVSTEPRKTPLTMLSRCL